MNQHGMVYNTMLYLTQMQQGLEPKVLLKSAWLLMSQASSKQNQLRMCGKWFSLQGIKWSTDTVFQHTMQKAQELHLEAYTLPVLRDIDTVQVRDSTV